jgi:hypothetical protein
MRFPVASKRRYRLGDQAQKPTEHGSAGYVNLAPSPKRA